MAKILVDWSQCTYRCVVLPDPILVRVRRDRKVSQCTYRCVVLPDTRVITAAATLARRLNAPTGAWCSLTLEFAAIVAVTIGLNAPTGAWCSLTPALGSGGMTPLRRPGAPPAPGAPLRTGRHRAQSST